MDEIINHFFIFLKAILIPLLWSLLFKKNLKILEVIVKMCLKPFFLDIKFHLDGKALRRGGGEGAYFKRKMKAKKLNENSHFYSFTKKMQSLILQNYIYIPSWHFQIKVIQKVWFWLIRIPWQSWNNLIFSIFPHTSLIASIYWGVFCLSFGQVHWYFTLSLPEQSDWNCTL